MLGKKKNTKLWKVTVKVFTSSHSTNYHPVIDACLNSKRSPFQGTSVMYSEQISFRTGQIFRPQELENVAPFFCWQPRSPQQNVSFCCYLACNIAPFSNLKKKPIEKMNVHINYHLIRLCFGEGLLIDST